MYQLYSVPMIPTLFKRLKNWFCAVLFLVALLAQYVESRGCGAGTRVLFFYSDTAVDLVTKEGFSDTLFAQLRDPLREIGYCLTRFEKPIMADPAQDGLVMVLSMQKWANQQAASKDSIANVHISLVRLEEWFSQRGGSVLDNPLISLSYEAGELSTFESVLIKKTVENLRTQYVCHLRIQSTPPGVHIKSGIGLEGTTPLEWILPVGEFSISGELKGYELVYKKMELASPGIHTYDLQMRKQQFYRSKFMYPAVTFALASVACYITERYYYSKYLDLGRDDYYNNPELFADTYNKAKYFEVATLSALALSAVSLTFSFWF